MASLALAFFATALLYASVGFGGGSTYTALLALAGLDYRLLPIVSLSCNILVVAGGALAFARAGAVPWRRLLPILLVSAPLAWAGGRIAVPELLFTSLLGLALFIAGCLMLWSPQREEAGAGASTAASAAMGGGVGFVSGLVGIGGGIFLAPLLHLTQWGRAREIAGAASVFILVNSVAGLAGQIAKTGYDGAQGAFAYWPLALAVVLGGQIGSHAGARLLPARWLVGLTAGLVLLVAARLGLRALGMMTA